MLSCSTFDFFVKTLHDLSKFFFDTRMKPAGSPEREEFSYDNLLAPIRFIREVVNFFSGATMMSATFKFVDIVYRFVIVFWFISYQLKNQEQQQLEWYFTVCIENFSPDRTTTVLHAAIVDYKTKLQSIQLILELRADLNAMDEEGRTPLHMLAAEGRFFSKRSVRLFKTPVNAGVNYFAVFKKSVNQGFFNCHILSNIGLIDSFYWNYRRGFQRKILNLKTGLSTHRVHSQPAKLNKPIYLVIAEAQKKKSQE